MITGQRLMTGMAFLARLSCAFFTLQSHGKHFCKPVADELVRGFLMRQMMVPDYKAEICVAFARGNIGKAKALASSEDFENVKSEALSLLKYINEGSSNVFKMAFCA